MRILIYGASNVWGFMPGSYDPSIGQGKQYPREQRWTSILEAALPGVEITIDGLNGRTTAFDDVFAGKSYRNGSNSLPEALDKNTPLDWVIFFLGTNDLKIQQEKSVSDSAEGMRKLIQCVKSSRVNSEGKAPCVLTIAPQPIGEGHGAAYFDASSVAKSYEVPAAFESVAVAEGTEFLNTLGVISSSPKDGIHLEHDQHAVLGKLVAAKIKAICPKLTKELKS